MPINRRWPIAALLDAARRFPLSHGRRVTFEYVLLAGVNDSDADADRLVRLLRDIPCKVNLIPWNGFPIETADGPVYRFQRPSAERIRTFQERVRVSGMAIYIRSPRGDDIDAACGQLAARTVDGPRAPPRGLTLGSPPSAHGHRRPADQRARPGHRRLRSDRRVLGLHAHHGSRLRPPVSVA